MVVNRRTLVGTLSALAIPRWAQALGAPKDAPVLDITGAVGQPNVAAAAVFDLPMLEALPQRSIKTRTPWHEGEPVFTGPLLRDLLAAAGAAGTTLRMFALNDYRVDVPLDDAKRLDVVVARHIDGRAIAVRDKGPLFVMYPFDSHPELRNAVYYTRCIWQLRRIEVR